MTKPLIQNSGYDKALAEKVLGVFKSPRLSQTDEGGWRPQA